jgi:hypothetical protein
VNREACGERTVDHENGSGTCPIGIHDQSVLEGDMIESRRHLNLQLVQLRLHGRDTLLVRFPVHILIFPDRNVNVVKLAVRLDALVELAADEPLLLGDIALYVLPLLHKFFFLRFRDGKHVD